jgi:hypothetical protein
MLGRVSVSAAADQQPHSIASVGRAILSAAVFMFIPLCGMRNAELQQIINHQSQIVNPKCQILCRCVVAESNPCAY